MRANFIRLNSILANLALRNFWIGVDSAFADILEQMRDLDGVVAGIEKALPIFNATIVAGRQRL